jgi:hypothetical protein
VAEPAPTSGIQEQIEESLDYLIREWEGIPELATVWPTRDAAARDAFSQEWLSRDERLEELREYARAVILTPAQREQYERLLHLVAVHRPTLELLLAI